MAYQDRSKSRPGTTRRVRHDHYDYSTPGYYFVTICTHNRQPYLGEIIVETMHLSPAGAMVSATFLELEDKFQTVTTDAFEVMPNHVHLLIGIGVRASDEPNIDNLIDIIHWFKSTTHQRFRSGDRSQSWDPYDGAVWQEGFHDHIVRNEKELDTLRHYVATNVETWGKDRFYDGMRRR